MTPIVAIGPESAAPASALAAGIEAALIRSGLLVFNATSSSNRPSVVVEATLQRVGPRARVLVRVLSPDPAAPVWADQIDFQIDASLAAQDTVATRVTRAAAAAWSRFRALPRSPSP